MTELPEKIRRLQVLQWARLLENHGFTSDCLKWHESPTRRQKAALAMYSGKPQPINSVGSRAPTNREVPVKIAEWERERQSRLSNANDPVVTDFIGISESISLARERFSEVLRDYLALWAFETKGDSDEFAH